MGPEKPSSVRDWASKYISKGWQVVPLAPGTKACTDDNWLKLIFKPEDFNPDDNIGIRSVNGLVVIDEDCPEVIACADAFLPSTGAIWGRPSKLRSKRLYVSVFPKTLALKDQENGNTLIEIRSQHQDMAPPSRHPGGELLEWDGDVGDATQVENTVLMRAVRLVATSAIIGRYYAPPGGRHDWCLALSGMLRRLGLTLDESTRVLEAAAAYAGDAKLADRLTEVRSTYSKSEEDPVKGAKALNDLSSVKTFTKSLTKIWGDTSSVFILNDRGDKILANHQENVKRAFARLEVDLKFNVFSQKPIIKFNGYRGTLQDEIRNHLWLEIDRRFGFRPNGDFFDVVLSDVAHQNEFHPVVDYLDKLEWDGTPRLDGWLIKHGKAADTPYVRAVSSLVLIAAVRRVTQPGCKFDELMVLESNQGKLKSSALQCLCPEQDWFSDDLPLNVDAKQIIERTLGKWIIEAAELSGMHRSQTEHLKAMLSRQIDGPVRLAYARLPVERPRQFIIVGTTNAHTYLKDSTGNRRFWPVRVDTFDLDKLVKERDQLWAEARLREKEGHSIRLMPILYEHAGFQQERRRAVDPWETYLNDHFEEHQKYRLTITEVWEILGIPLGQRDERNNERLFSIMQRLGFKRSTVRRGKIVSKGWCRDAETLPMSEDDAVTEPAPQTRPGEAPTDF